MADFLIAYKITSANEGGYVNDPHDSGGETYAGITRKNFPHWPGWIFIDNHKPIKYNTIFPELELLVEAFYKIEFWHPINGDNITDQEIANDAYDMAVNAGIGAALKMLKQA